MCCNKKMFFVHAPQVLPVSSLNPVGYNPRKISIEKFDALKKNIVEEGFIEPIVVQKKGLRIIGGHQRAKAVKELSIEAGESPPDLPCIVLDVDDVRAKRLNIKLNSLRGEFEARMLGELLLDISDDEVKIAPEEALDLGFTQDEAIKFMRLIEPDTTPLSKEDGEEIQGFAKSITLSIEFSSLEDRDRVKKQLMERSEVEKKRAGDIVASLLFQKRTPSIPPKPPSNVVPMKTRGEAKAARKRARG